MIQLKRSLQAWGTRSFADVLKDEIGSLDASVLPLQAGLTQGSYACDAGFSVVVMGFSESHKDLHAKAGIFYTSVISGCSCADDPTPVDELSEYCEVQLDIDRTTAVTSISLLSE